MCKHNIKRLINAIDSENERLKEYAKQGLWERHRDGVQFCLGLRYALQILSQEEK